MRFAFLNPWFWLGLIAVGAPLWLHLRRRKERNLVRFPTLRFLDDQPHARKSPLRLRDLLLFALRLLALVMLVAAFAWPYRRETGMQVVKESRVYVLDNTLSHQANDGFNKAREQVLSELNKAGPDIQVAVVELTGQPRVVAAFGDDRETARQKINDLQPSFQRGSYLAAFRQANMLLANSLGDRKRIIFLSDQQENQWTDNTSSPPFLQNVEVELSKPGGEGAPNLALSEPKTQRVFLGDKSLVNFSVKLHHDGPAKAANLVLRVNEQVIFNKSLELEKSADTISLHAQWEAEPGLWQRGELTVDASPDSLPGDNRVFFSLAPVKEGRVAVLAQSTFLRVALSPEVMRGHWAARVLDPAKLAAELEANRDADVLCLEANYLQSPEARKLVWRYLTNGRGVILFVNRVTPVINGALRELGFEVVSGQPRASKGEALEFVLSSHPIFHPFLAADYGNLADVKIHKQARLKPSQGGMPLAFTSSGDAILFQGVRHPGKLLVAAFGLERDQTNWPLQVTFIPFLDLCLQNARLTDKTPVDYEPGDISVIELPPDATVREVVLRDGPNEIARAAAMDGKAQLRMPGRPGLYAVTYDAAKETEKIVSVNPSPKESRLRYIGAPETLKSWELAAEREPVKASAAAPLLTSQAAIWRQHFWWWLALAALGALLIETAWAGWRKAQA